MILNAKSTELLSILSLDRKLEQLPEPWRLQKNLAIRIDFNIFRDFMLNCAYTKDLVHIDIDTMRQCLLDNDTTFNNHYYRQLCLAQLKELSYAQTYDSYATCILPYIPQGKTVRLSEVNKSGQLLIYQYAIQPTLDFLKSFGFAFTIPTEQDKNYNLFVLCLYYFSKSSDFDSVVTVENIILS